MVAAASERKRDKRDLRGVLKEQKAREMDICHQVKEHTWFDKSVNKVLVGDK
jgi:hypothetical protein